jgi:hypothetical protein
MRRRIATYLIIVIVLGLAYALYAKRLQLKALGWHWQHGDFIWVQNYEVPVPRT